MVQETKKIKYSYNKSKVIQVEYACNKRNINLLIHFLYVL